MNEATCVLITEAPPVLNHTTRYRTDALRLLFHGLGRFNHEAERNNTASEDFVIKPLGATIESLVLKILSSAHSAKVTYRLTIESTEENQSGQRSDGNCGKKRYAQNTAASPTNRGTALKRGTQRPDQSKHQSTNKKQRRIGDGSIEDSPEVIENSRQQGKG